MSKPFYRSIMIKILAMILMISFFETFALVFMSHTLTEGTMETLVHERSDTNEEMYSSIIGNWFAERIGEMKMYANSPAVKGMDWNTAEPYLRNEIQDKLNFYDHFLVAEPNGEFNTTLKRHPSNIRDREYFKSVMKGETVISNPMISRTTGNQIVVAATPIRDSNGKVIGLMGGTINLVKLRKIIEPFKVDHPGSYSFIIDKHGLVISHPDKVLIMQEGIDKASKHFSNDFVQLSKKILATKSGNAELTIADDQYMIYYHVIPYTDNWRILTLIPLSYLHEPIDYTSKMLAILGFAGIILALLAGIIVSRTISKPIIQLKNLFTKAESGDLTVEANIKTHDEIEAAAQSFNSMMQTINNLTFNDPLTGLPNRVSFMKRLELEINHAERNSEKLAVMVIDIDKFESINNTLGHDIGNRLLQVFAGRLDNEYRRHELISRISEDKFSLLYTDIAHEKDVIMDAQNILALIKQPFEVNGNSLYITACVGIAFYPGDANSSEELFKNAYSAMQRAKRAGRDNYQLYDPAVSSNFAEHLYLDTSMHDALKNNELTLHYQPQVNIDSNEIVGMEALLRWKHSELGMVSPAKFIPIAESNGLIVPIGDWVLMTACSETKKLHEQGYKNLYVSVNISAMQLREEGFLDKVSTVLDDTGLQPQYLELEITESIFMEDTDSRIDALNKLKKMGIRIAIDDFGTGYSSLNYLKSFEITTLKIDQSFVRDITCNPKVAAIVSAILAIGRNLQLSVTAEGVETDEQLDFLKEKKCDAIQGYLFSRPVPIETLESMLRNK